MNMFKCWFCIVSGVPIVPGTDGPVTTKEEAKEFCMKHGLPVIFKVIYYISAMFSWFIPLINFGIYNTFLSQTHIILIILTTL